MSKVADNGYLDLLIKVYLRNMQQTGGVFSQYIDRMKEGVDTLKITAIGGDIAYLGNSKFLLRNEETKEMEERTFNKVGMIAAGSGITPMF
jgi:ferredoxin-NADP reductase